MKVEDCFDYLETKEKYANEKCLKRANFQTAVDQIEQAIANGEDAAPIDVSKNIFLRFFSKKNAQLRTLSVTSIRT